MENFSNAAKAVIIKDGRILLIKRRPNDPHGPDKWDIPGGRLAPGENPFLGLKRECQEELGIAIEILLPFAIQHFTRDDGQVITMMMFLCRPLTDSITLSEEHTEYQWLNLDAPLKDWPGWLVPAIETIHKYKLAIL